MQPIQKTKPARVDAIAVLPPAPLPNATIHSSSIELPKQLIIILFFACLFSFALNAWRESRFFDSNELLVLLGVRSGAGLLFWWLEIDD